MTTDLPEFSAVSSSERAGSMPPMSSITMSTSGRDTSAAASVVSRLDGTGTRRARLVSRTATPTTSSAAPARAARSADCSVSRR